MIGPTKNGHSCQCHSDRDSTGQQHKWSQLMVVSLCCAAILLSITSLVRSYSLEQRILTLESNCEYKYLSKVSPNRTKREVGPECSCPPGKCQSLSLSICQINIKALACAAPPMHPMLANDK